MMKNITLKLKHLVLFTTLAMFSVAASAVNVTYSLTTFQIRKFRKSALSHQWKSSEPHIWHNRQEPTT